MLKECLTKYHVFVIMLVKLIFDDCELALVWSLEKVLRRVNFKNSFTTSLWSSGDEKANRLNLILNFCTFCSTLAEWSITLAVKIGYSFSPFCFQTLEECSWNSNDGATSINYSWICSSISNLWSSIEETFSWKCPCFDVAEYIWIVSKWS